MVSTSLTCGTNFFFVPVSVGLDLLSIHKSVRHVRTDKDPRWPVRERVTPFGYEIFISYAGDLNPNPDQVRAS